MRRSITLALPAVALAALVLSGCGSDDDGDSDSSAQDTGTQQSESSEQQESTDPDAEESEDANSAGGEGVEGVWSTSETFADPADNQLVISQGLAGLVLGSAPDGTGNTVCNGTATGTSLSLTCLDGSTEHAEGTLALEGDTLDITWGSGGTETYYRQDIPVPDFDDVGDLESVLDGLQQELGGLDGLEDLGASNG